MFCDYVSNKCNECERETNESHTFSPPDSEAIALHEKQFRPLLKHCTSLVTLNIARTNCSYISMKALSSDIRRLRCSCMFGEHIQFGHILCVCERLAAFGFAESSPIKQITITDAGSDTESDDDDTMQSSADAVTQFTLQFIGEAGVVASNIADLARINAPLVNLVIHVPTPTEDSRKIAESLHNWTNLMTYDFHLGFQLSADVCKLFPNMVFVGHSDRLPVPMEPYFECERQPTYKYICRRTAQSIEGISASDPLDRQFMAWKKATRNVVALKRLRCRRKRRN